MKLTKSVSDSKPPPRLNRTLKRDVTVRDFVEDDIKYLWVAYQKGAMAFEKGLSPAQFREVMTDWMVSQYDFAWTIECEGKPVGVVNAINCGLFVLMGDSIWFPWASPRNKIEGFVRLIVTLREQMMLMGYATQKDKNFFVHIAKHGVIRRVGTIHELGEEPLAFFQSRNNGRHH